MATHEILFDMPQKLVLSKDITFEVKSDGNKLGTLLISKGNVEWKPANHSVTKHRMTWEKFAAIMEDEGKTTRKK